MKPYYEQSGITIYHGDCRDVLPLLSGVDAIICDPPYGVGATYTEAYDDDRETYWAWFVPCVGLLRASARVVAFTHRVKALAMFTDWDWVLVWHKPGTGGARIGNSPLVPYWEPILVYGAHSLGTKREALPDVLTINPATGGKSAAGVMGRERLALSATEYHPHPKPRELMTRLIRGLSDPTHVICDPFMGSGTTLDAAKHLHQRAIGIEIEERYCEIAAKRLQQEALPLEVA